MLLLALQVLDFILSGDPADKVADSIEHYLETLASQIRDNKIALSKYVITKAAKKVRY